MLAALKGALVTVTLALALVVLLTTPGVVEADEQDCSASPSTPSCCQCSPFLKDGQVQYYLCFEVEQGLAIPEFSGYEGCSHLFCPDEVDCEFGNPGN